MNNADKRRLTPIEETQFSGFLGPYLRSSAFIGGSMMGVIEFPRMRV
jgi:hypothetical protein